MKNHVAISAAILVVLGLITLLLVAPSPERETVKNVRLPDVSRPHLRDDQPSPPPLPAPEPESGPKPQPPPTPAAEPSVRPQTGKIIVASALEDREHTAYLAAFHRRYPGIQVHVHRKSTGDLVRLIREQRDNPTFDVIWGVSVTKVLGLQADGLLHPVHLDGLDALTDIYVDNAHRTGSSEVHWVGMKTLTTALCVRADSDYIARSPDDLARRIHRAPGRAVIMPAPTASGTGLVFVASIIQSRGWDDGWALLDAIDRNVEYYTSSGSAPCRAVARQSKNEDLVGVSLGITALDIAEETRGTASAVKAVFFAEDIPWEIEASALVEKPEIDPAAVTFLQWSIGADAMAAYNAVTPAIAWKSLLPRPAPGFPEDLKRRLMKKTTESVYRASGYEARILAEWTRRYGSKVR